MKIASLFISVLLLTALTAARAAQPEVLTVAVFDFEARDDVVRDLGPKVAALINASLSAEPKIITVERADLEKILGEQELGLSGTVSSESAAKVGHLTGAKVIVTGRAFILDKDRILVAKVISTETSLVYGEVVRGPSGGSVADLADELAKKIAKTVSDKADTLVAKVASREERVQKIRDALKGKTLPAVSVKVGERHFGQPVIDPAAETEFGKTLLECGFTLVDDKSKQKADIEITGDAFSAFGMRKGNLITCKARIEIKAQDVDNRKLLVADRQTSVAVDITEQTAAKSALQNAALDLAERVLPQLVK